jgi:imidazole glycerol-phosphate synthase subunit HisH
MISSCCSSLPAWSGARTARSGAENAANGLDDLVIDAPHLVFDGLSSGDHAYFVHSYQFHVTDPVQWLAHVEYGGDVTAVIGCDTLLGTQFRPEKSQHAGLRTVVNFLRWTP